MLSELQIETIIAETCGTYRTGGSYTFEDVWNCIEKALAAHSAGAQEPVTEDHECVYENGDGVCRQCVSLAKQSKVFGYARRTDGYRTTGQTPEDHELCNADAPGAFALYTHPQPQPQPMTDAARDVAFEITPEIASEWARRQDIEHVLKDFSTQRCAIEDARTLHLAEIERLDRAKGE